MRRAPANATIDKVQVLGGALVGLLAFTHVSVKAASTRCHSRHLHCKWLVRAVGDAASPLPLNNIMLVSLQHGKFLQQLLLETGYL